MEIARWVVRLAALRDHPPLAVLGRKDPRELQARLARLARKGFRVVVVVAAREMDIRDIKGKMVLLRQWVTKDFKDIKRTTTALRVRP